MAAHALDIETNREDASLRVQAHAPQDPPGTGRSARNSTVIPSP